MNRCSFYTFNCYINRQMRASDTKAKDLGPYSQVLLTRAKEVPVDVRAVTSDQSSKQSNNVTVRCDRSFSVLASSTSFAARASSTCRELASIWERREWRKVSLLSYSGRLILDACHSSQNEVGGTSLSGFDMGEAKTLWYEQTTLKLYSVCIKARRLDCT